MKRRILLFPDRTVNPEDGLLRPEAGTFVNPEPVFVPAGTTLRPRSSRLSYRLFGYGGEICPQLLYTYVYQPESNWTSYRRDAFPAEWRSGDARVGAEGWLRAAVRPEEGAGPLRYFDEAFDVRLPEGYCAPPEPTWIAREAESVAGRVRKLRRPGDRVFLLLADTHYATGGNWPDTLAGLRRTAERIGPDAVIHLGDLTDGLLSRALTERFAGCVLEDLKALGLPVYLCIGNHDTNYFRGNPERIPIPDCARFYLGRERPYYFVDLPGDGLRLFFLDSFSAGRRERYGFSDEELRWFGGALSRAPKGARILVFSHVTPLAEMHVWSGTILNGPEMLSLLSRHGGRRGRRALGWICGHNHADQILHKYPFPIVTIGSGKTECFPEHKPWGAATPRRQPGTRTQELWDVLLVHREGDLDFVRFGAGGDRGVRFGTDGWDTAI